MPFVPFEPVEPSEPSEPVAPFELFEPFESPLLGQWTDCPLQAANTALQRNSSPPGHWLHPGR